MLRSGPCLVSLILWLHLGSTFLCLALIQYTRDNGEPCFQSETTSNQKICYAFTPSTVTWAAAESACVSENGTFVTVQEAATQDALAGALQSTSIAQAWIGAHKDIGNWSWNGDPLQALGTPTFWRSGNPSAYSPTMLNECGRIYSPDGYTWEDQVCAFHTAFICETVPSDPTCNSTNADFNLVLTTGSRCFLFHNTKLSWSDASLFCQTRNTSLAKVDTQEVQDLLTTNEPGKAERIDGYWMGLTRSTWRWYTGDAISMTFWEASQPSRTGECARIERFDSTTFLWGNWNCTASLQALCAVDVPQVTTTVAMTTASNLTTGVASDTTTQPSVDSTVAMATTPSAMETTATAAGIETTTMGNTPSVMTTAAPVETTSVAMDTTAAAMETASTAMATSSNMATGGDVSSTVMMETASVTQAMTTAANNMPSNVTQGMTTVAGNMTSNGTQDVTTVASNTTSNMTSSDVTTMPFDNVTTGNDTMTTDGTMTTVGTAATTGSNLNGVIAAVAILLGVVGFILGTASVAVLVTRYRRKRLMEKESLLRPERKRSSRPLPGTPDDELPPTTLTSTTATMGKKPEDEVYSVPRSNAPIRTTADVHHHKRRHLIRYTHSNNRVPKSKKSRARSPTHSPTRSPARSPASSRGSSQTTSRTGFSSNVSTPWGSVRGVGPYLHGKPRPVTLDFMPQDRFNRTMPADAWGMSSRWSNRLY